MANPSIPTTCTAVTNQLLYETGRLQAPMFKRVTMKRPILRLQSSTRGAWMNGMGQTVGAVTFERSFPALTGDPWATISASDGSSNACIPPNEIVSFGETTRTYSPRQYSINTQDWCVRDIAFGWQFNEFLGNVTRALETISEWVWYRRMTQDYFDNSGHKVTLNAALGPGDAGIQDSATVYNTSNLATAGLSQGVLNYIYSDLMREGGGNPTGIDETTGAAVFTLITSAEASDRIIRNNPDLRQDERFAYMGLKEAGPVQPGINTYWRRRQYGGFIHEIDPFPRRFLFNGAAYVEVAPWIQTTTTKGFAWNQNPAYKTAPFEEAIIWHQDTYQDLTVNTLTTPAPGWNFDPHNWLGQFSPRNIPDRTCNQDMDTLYMRALFASAAKPINPYVGWTILFARCSQATDISSCYNS